jgi:hypothetical protein
VKTCRAINDGDVVWVPVSVMAEVFSRNPWTIRRWCIEGYIVQLGYRVKRESRGQWKIGVTPSEYRTFRTQQIASAS